MSMVIVLLILFLITSGGMCYTSPLTVLRFLFFFFFQAEDGIRDLIVTGVQTCALPISPGSTSSSETASRSRALAEAGERLAVSELEVEPGDERAAAAALAWRASALRSEERRVGEECRSRWSAYH